MSHIKAILARLETADPIDLPEPTTALYLVSKEVYNQAGASMDTAPLFDRLRKRLLVIYTKAAMLIAEQELRRRKNRIRELALAATSGSGSLGKIAERMKLSPLTVGILLEIAHCAYAAKRKG